MPLHDRPNSVPAALVDRAGIATWAPDPEVMADEPHDSGGGFARLEQAFSAFLQYDRTPTDADREAFLNEHGPLRDLLEPMLADTVIPDAADAIESFVRGRVLDDFRLVQEIGSGGMGVVWEATQISLGRTVAIKLLPQSFTFSPRAIARFRREATLTAQLDHPGLVRVLAFGQDRDTFWYAMELVQGQSLDRAITDGAFTGETGATRAIEVASRVANALDHAHRSGVIHRDVKPANILLRTADDAAVLTDFGLARQPDLPGLTMEGTFAGTPYYVSPEQAESADRVDARSDVFSLGATLFEMLTGQRAFEGASVHDVLDSIRSREPIDPRRLSRHVSADMAAVVQRALEKRPEHRYPSSAAFAADLDAILTRRPVSARPVSVTTRWLRAARREPLKAGLIIAIAVAAPTAAALGGYLFAQRGTLDAGERSLHERSVEQRYARGFADLANNQPRAALRSFGELLAHEGPSVESIAASAIAAVRAKQPELAQQLLTEHSAFVQANDALDRVVDYVEQSTAPIGPDGIANPNAPRTHSELMVEAMLAYAAWSESGRRDDARRAFALWTETIATSPRAREFHHIQRAHAAGSGRDNGEIEIAARSLEALWPESAYAASARGYALSFADPRAASRAFEVAVAGVPEDATIAANYGVVLNRLDQPEAAERWMRRAIELDPAAAGPRIKLGELLARTGRRDERIDQVRHAVELAPDNARCYVSLATVLSISDDRNGKSDLRNATRPEVLAARKKAVELEPGNAEAHYNLAVYFLRVDRGPDAIPLLERSCQLDPNLFEAWANLGPVLEHAGRADEAVVAFETATRLRPEEYWPWFRLGRALRRSNPERAANALRQAIELKPDHAMAHHVLGLTTGALGDWIAASEHFYRALEVNGDDGSKFSQAATAQATDPDRAALARAIAHAAIRRNTTSEWAHAVVLRASVTLEDHAAVRAEHRRWARANANDPDAWAALAEDLLTNAPVDSDAARRAIETGLIAPNGAGHDQLLRLRAKL